MSPTAISAPPDSKTLRGPTRSTAHPLTEPARKYTHAVMENTAAAADLPTPNSSAIGLKKAPKL